MQNEGLPICKDVLNAPDTTTGFVTAEETCTLCATWHRLRDCSAAPQEYKCIDCVMYSKYNQNKPICAKHSSLDKKCPSLQALLDKYRRNTDN